MRKIALFVGLTVVVSFALGYYVGGLAREERALPVEASTAERAEEVTGSIGSESAATASNDATEPPMQGLAHSEMTPPNTREVTPEFMASMERGARHSHASFFHLYGIPPSEVDAIVKGMAQGKIEQIKLLEQMAILESRAPLGASGLTEEDQQVADELIATHKSRRAGKSRQLWGSYYDDYQEYLTTMKEHDVIAQVSTGLDQPINSVTRDEMLQIMVEEGLYGWQRPTSTPARPVLEELTRDERLARHRKRVELFGERSERIKERARSYLSVEEYELLAEILDREVERREADTQVRELSDNP